MDPARTYIHTYIHTHIHTYILCTCTYPSCEVHQLPTQVAKSHSQILVAVESRYTVTMIPRSQAFQMFLHAIKIAGKPGNEACTNNMCTTHSKNM